MSEEQVRIGTVIDLGDSKSTLRQLQGAIKDAKIEMERLDQSTKDYDRALSTLTTAQGDYTQAVGQTIRNQGQLQNHLNSVTNAINGTLGGFQALQGIMALTGGENEKLVSTLVKLQAVASIAAGFKSFTTAVQGSTLAMRLFNTAVASNPLGLLLVGITSAIALFSTLSDSISDTGKEIDDLSQKRLDLKAEVENYRGSDTFESSLDAVKAAETYKEEIKTLYNNYITFAKEKNKELGKEVLKIFDPKILESDGGKEQLLSYLRKTYSAINSELRNSYMSTMDSKTLYDRAIIEDDIKNKKYKGQLELKILEKNLLAEGKDRIEVEHTVAKRRAEIQKELYEYIEETESKLHKKIIDEREETIKSVTDLANYIGTLEKGSGVMIDDKSKEATNDSIDKKQTYLTESKLHSARRNLYKEYIEAGKDADETLNLLERNSVSLSRTLSKLIEENANAYINYKDAVIKANEAADKRDEENSVTAEKNLQLEKAKLKERLELQEEFKRLALASNEVLKTKLAEQYKQSLETNQEQLDYEYQLFVDHNTKLAELEEKLQQPAETNDEIKEKIIDQETYNSLINELLSTQSNVYELEKQRMALLQETSELEDSFAQKKITNETLLQAVKEEGWIKQEEYNEILGIPKNAIEQRAMLEVEAENLEIKIELIEKELQAETLAQEEKIRLLNELNEYQDLYLKNTDNRAKAEINVRKATTDAIQSGLGLTKSVLKDAGAAAGEHTAAGKALAIAAATIDTYQSATMAYKSQLPLGPAGPALGIAAATAAVASGLANVKRILSVKVPGKGSDGQGGGMPNIQQPEFLEPVKFVQESYTNLSGDDLDIINNKNQTHKVIVVESDITNVQNRVRAVENDSSF